MTVNIYNPEDITSYLVSFVFDKKIATQLCSVLHKPLCKREESAVELKVLPDDAPEWLQNKWDICGPFHKFKPDAALDDKIIHICDWLLTTKTQNIPVTTRQLQTLATLDNLVAAADKYFEEHNKKQPKIIEDDNDTKTVMSFDDGSRIVQLLTPNALRYEGPGMGHCIGGGSYDKSLLEGSCVFYSLRDKDNNPHATFHVDVKGNALRQCKGKKNEPPVQKYMPYVQQFVTENKFQLKEGPLHTGLVQGDDGQYHSIFNLPESLTVSGSLDLNGCAGLTRLPKNLSVGGSLDLGGCTDLTRLPENLSVGGWLDLNDCTGLTRLPENLAVGGKLDLRRCTTLTQLSKNLSVAGDLELGGCTSLTHLPEKLSVADSLNVSGCTNLTQLPKEMSIGKNLYLLDCKKLKQLPERLSINGEIHLESCTNLTQLPNNLSVKWLWLNGCTSLKSIPYTIKCGERIFTDLGPFNTVAEAADEFDKKYGRAAPIRKSSPALKAA